MAKPDRVFVFKDPTRLTQWVKWLLYASIVLSIVGLVSGVMEYRTLLAIKDGAFATDAEMVEAANANETRQQLIGVLQIALVIVAVVVIGVWIYRANANARALGAAGMRFTPGRSILPGADHGNDVGLHHAFDLGDLVQDRLVALL